MLDADAVALDAARANVPAAARAFLCSGWPDPRAASPASADGAPPPTYDWIVSNPPVHRGQPDDFSVVQLLIRGAPARLRRGGVLWLVCQEQVPVGRMLAADGRYAWVEATVSDDGRFVTWSAGVGGQRVLAAPPPVAAQPTLPRKRKRDTALAAPLASAKASKARRPKRARPVGSGAFWWNAVWWSGTRLQP